jgi:Fur family peroxide stress response transcriptional regulator
MTRKDHPTADVVYQNVRQEFPNISLGTVYRNLSLLVEIGEAVKTPSVDNCEHFDADTSPHYHFLCRECGAVIDIDMDDCGMQDTFIHMAQKGFDGHIESCKMHFVGVCRDCCQKSERSS